ncbi:hypothetical protein CVU82_03385 [Candidatus Falkowbacteria bacterium HGW-Falkowbacteria-1]|jgi:spermidine/putrescine-binding protein|uniref:Uncharacterized protein n=1 Tax=Candidatus Falkowbacteria bacterium HGW-Falkowbacteria-1 TaxID=2013768 RepID=A0A2N2E8L0_9BACT|nr:MAG: hypothetical protein CVU82_03385 [Candidatus Falkowbacteria bacterium HGW-Falkowbacteria-1]
MAATTIEKAVQQAQRTVRIGDSGLIEKDHQEMLARVKNVSDPFLKKTQMLLLEQNYVDNKIAYNKAKKFLDEFRDHQRS